MHSYLAVKLSPTQGCQQLGKCSKDTLPTYVKGKTSSRTITEKEVEIIIQSMALLRFF